jgi:hypothetical protein
MKKNLITRLVGLAVVVASCAYLLLALRRHAAALPAIAWSPAAGAAFGGAVLLYLASLPAGALGWSLLLRAVGAGAPFGTLLRICALALPAKYLPGNVGHYLGRAELARRAGLPLREVGLTLIFETAWAVVAAAALAAALLTLDLGVGWRLALLALLALAVPPLLVRLLDRWRPGPVRRLLGDAPLVFPGLPAFAGCLLADWLSFAACGAALALLERVLFAQPDLHLAGCTAVFALAWVAGFVVPGAPGGLGIREALLTAGLTPLYGAATALTLALTFRVVTVLGDALGFLLAWVARHSSR